MLDSSELFKAIGGEEKNDRDDIIDRFRSDSSLDIPIELTDLDLWSNYINEDLYVMDKKVREFFKKTRFKRAKKGGYRTTAPVVFAWIYGHQPTARDGAACKMLHTLLKYYCTSWTGMTTYNGKPVNRVYKFGPYTTNNKRPYSLKLRLEEAKPGDAIWRGNPGAGESKRTYGRQSDSNDRTTEA